MKLQTHPSWKVVVTHSGSDYTFEDDTFTSIRVDTVENGIDLANLVCSDYQGIHYLSQIAHGDVIKIYEKDKSDASWNTLLIGVIDVTEPILGDAELLNIECSGAAYGFGEMVCGEEYGTQSSHSSLDTIKEILTDATYGVVPKWVNKILGSATDSGYNYDTANVETITGMLNYTYFPFKPCSRVLDDLCDLVTAIKAGGAGPHWIVTPDNKLRVKLIGATQTGWTKYYGGSQAAATLEQDKVLVNFQFQNLKSEANYILYYGATVKPIQLDDWTNNNSGDWQGNTYLAVSDDASGKLDYAIKMTTQATGGVLRTAKAYYPSSLDLGLNITNISGRYSIPVIHMWLKCDADFYSDNIVLAWDCLTDATNYYNTAAYASDLFKAGDEWVEVTMPIGPNAAKAERAPSWFVDWNAVNSPNWNNINGLGFHFFVDADARDLWCDNLYLRGEILRAAKNSTKITSDKAKIRVISDNIGKYDSWNASDDSGTIARLAYQELLRRQTEPLVGRFTVPILPDLLPGQYLHVHAKKKADGTFKIDKDMRVIRVIHAREKTSLTQITVTDDLTNSHPRRAFDDVNKVMADVRPEFQDRQATSIKARDIDISLTLLEKDYPS